MLAQAAADRKNRVCPVERAGALDGRIRRLVQNPFKILSPWVREGMTVVDLGCGPGYFTVPLAQLVGPEGSVVAVDLQQGMLDKVEAKVRGTQLETRVVLHSCEAERIGLTTRADFVLAFYVVHEVPDQAALFAELVQALNEGGIVFVEEPPFHVSSAAFQELLNQAQAAGLDVVQRPRRLLGRAAVLRKR
jgi:ubiquinone/menaquinone biosynthesis C-methylase UbiE